MTLLGGFGVDLLGQVRLVAGKRLAPSDFVQWFTASLWELESSLDDTTLDFAYLLENRIAEYLGGHIDEDRLRAAIASDLEVFDRHLEVRDPSTIEAFVAEDVGRFLEGELTFNNLVGRVQSASSSLQLRGKVGAAPLVGQVERLLTLVVKRVLETDELEYWLKVLLERRSSNRELSAVTETLVVMNPTRSFHRPVPVLRTTQRRESLLTRSLVFA